MDKMIMLGILCIVFFAGTLAGAKSLSNGTFGGEADVIPAPKTVYSLNSGTFGGEATVTGWTTPELSVSDNYTLSFGTFGGSLDMAEEDDSGEIKNLNNRGGKYWIYGAFVLLIFPAYLLYAHFKRRDR